METLNLTYGAHRTPEEGMCLMEAVAYIAGEEHSDRPECACPVLSAYGRDLNDLMGEGAEGDALRAQYLAPLAAKLVGTRSTSEVEQKRAYFFADRAVRLFAPLALESAGLGEAARLRSLAEVVDEKTARNADAAAWAAANAAADAAAWAAASAASAASWAATAADAADAASWAAASWAADAASRCAFSAAAREQVVRVLVEACGITEGGE